MGVESRFAIGPWGAHVLPFRSWKTILILALTMLLVIPLYQLRDHTAATYYKQYIYDHIQQYLDQDGVYNNTLYQDGTQGAVHPTYNFSAPCNDFPNTDGILLVMKTGATEVFDKLPTQLLTSMQCLPDSLIFSDLEQQIGKYHIYDALADVNANIRAAHKEFELYQAQLDCPVSQKDCTANMKGGWDLDKYKFIHMLVKAWEMRPGLEWYIFAEADTYIFWSALTEFLRDRAKPKEDLYIGSVAMVNGNPFAHGGSGYVLSGPLLRKIVETIPDVAAAYDVKAGENCCGDFLISLAAAEVGTKVKQAHPMFNGEKPNTLPYGPGHWCEPLLTMHHLNSEELAMVWQYEQTRTTPDITLIKDLYQTFFAPHLTDQREDWSNLSDDNCFIAPDEKSQKEAGGHEKGRQKEEDKKNVIEKRAHISPDACQLVCEAANLNNISDEEWEGRRTDDERRDYVRGKYRETVEGNASFKRTRSCFQWKYHMGTCCTSRSFKLGAPKKESKEADKYTSGWFVQGINDWIETQDKCNGPAWRDIH